MCLGPRTPKPPEVKPPAPPPPIPPPPPAPKALPQAQPIELEKEKTKPNVTYGRKKSDGTRARAGGIADQLRVPLNTPGGGGGLNV